MNKNPQYSLWNCGILGDLPILLFFRIFKILPNNIHFCKVLYKYLSFASGIVIVQHSFVLQHYLLNRKVDMPSYTLW